MNENGLYFARFAFCIFWRIFFFRQVKNHTKPEIETPNFGGYAMLAKISFIEQNDLFFSELLDNSFFFLQNKKILAYLKYKQSYDFFSEPS